MDENMHIQAGQEKEEAENKKDNQEKEGEMTVMENVPQKRQHEDDMPAPAKRFHSFHDEDGVKSQPSNNTSFEVVKATAEHVNEISNGETVVENAAQGVREEDDKPVLPNHSSSLNFVKQNEDTETSSGGVKSRDTMKEAEGGGAGALMEGENEKGMVPLGDDFDDSDSSDESFKPGESESEVTEEYDTNPSSTDSEIKSGKGMEMSEDEESWTSEKSWEIDTEEIHWMEDEEEKTDKTVVENKVQQRQEEEDKPVLPNRSGSLNFVKQNEDTETSSGGVKSRDTMKEAEGGGTGALLERENEKGMVPLGDDFDDSDSSDDSFKPGESESEVTEEYDTNPSSTNSEINSDKDMEDEESWTSEKSWEIDTEEIHWMEDKEEKTKSVVANEVQQRQEEEDKPVLPNHSGSWNSVKQNEDTETSSGGVKSGDAMKEAEGGGTGALLEGKNEKGKVPLGDDFDDSDSSDESFKPGESESEVTEEYDTNPSSTDSEIKSGKGMEMPEDEESWTSEKSWEIDTEEIHWMENEEEKTDKTVVENKVQQRQEEEDKPVRPNRSGSLNFVKQNEDIETTGATSGGVKSRDTMKEAEGGGTGALLGGEHEEGMEAVGDDSSDESFNPGESESEVTEEYDSTISWTDSEKPPCKDRMTDDEEGWSSENSWERETEKTHWAEGKEEKTDKGEPEMSVEMSSGINSSDTMKVPDHQHTESSDGQSTGVFGKDQSPLEMKGGEGQLVRGNVGGKEVTDEDSNDSSDESFSPGESDSEVSDDDDSESGSYSDESSNESDADDYYRNHILYGFVSNYDKDKQKKKELYVKHKRGSKILQESDSESESGSKHLFNKNQSKEKTRRNKAVIGKPGLIDADSDSRYTLCDDKEKKRKKKVVRRKPGLIDADSDSRYTLCDDKEKKRKKKAVTRKPVLIDTDSDNRYSLCDGISLKAAKKQEASATPKMKLCLKCNRKQLFESDSDSDSKYLVGDNNPLEQEKRGNKADMGPNKIRLNHGSKPLQQLENDSDNGYLLCDHSLKSEMKKQKDNKAKHNKFCLKCKSKPSPELYSHSKSKCIHSGDDQLPERKEKVDGEGRKTHFESKPFWQPDSDSDSKYILSEENQCKRRNTDVKKEKNYKMRDSYPSRQPRSDSGSKCLHSGNNQSKDEMRGNRIVTGQKTTDSSCHSNTSWESDAESVSRYSLTDANPWKSQYKKGKACNMRKTTKSRSRK